jgi:hypothetical protein
MQTVTLMLMHYSYSYFYYYDNQLAAVIVVHKQYQKHTDT